MPYRALSGYSEIEYGIGCYREQMELCPITDTLGYSEVLWTVQNMVRRATSKRWARQEAKVEGYEFLAAKNNGWLVVYYSYKSEGQWYSGQLRDWLLISTSDREGITTRAKELFPLASNVPIRVNPKAPEVSIFVAADRV